MFIKIFLQYILGYATIKVEGLFIERFINICISKRILLWNIKRKKSTIMYANIGINDFRRIKEVVRKTRSRLNIEDKRGMPFIMHRYRRRKIFVILLIVIFAMIIVMSKFIWNIEVIGNEIISKEEIIEELKENGIKVGRLKSKINSEKIISNVRLNRNDIAWMGISVEGTNVIVELKETRKAPEVIDKNKYCNVIADKEGVISQIFAQNGTAQFKVGDIVKVGEILVKGEIEGKYTGTRYVHAMADIKARVKYSKKEKVYFKQEVNIETGSKETKYQININNFNINFYKRLSKFEIYDTINTKKKLKLFSNFYLPVEINKIENYELQKKQNIYGEEELLDVTIPKLEGELKEEIKDAEEVINREVNIYSSEDFLEIEVIYEVLEKIGIQEEIIL